MEQAVRNKLRNVVTQCRKLLEESIAQQLEGQFGIRAGKKDAVQVEDEARMSHLSDEDKQYRRDLLDHFAHINARGFKAKDALDQLIREIAFTHLNRLCAYKMMEARDVYIGGQKFREAVSRGINSNGFKFYLADHAEDERLFNTGQQELAYRHFLDWLGGMLSEEIGVLFNPNDPANRLYPRQKTLDDLIGLLNGDDIKPEDRELQDEWSRIWEQDETLGWVYQYFTPKELRDQARKESAAPRNSYEVAFLNQFFTPRYVVEFLTDNTLGRIWYEIRKGDTKLKNQCRYVVRRPNEVFLVDGQEPPRTPESHVDLSQEELFQQPVNIPHRPKKDPRELKILDPACGSGHFLLYCFDLLLTIYEEAYDDPLLGPILQRDYATLGDLRRDVPRLILAHNLHGIDIDLRASQIAALALWLRCQRAYQEGGLKKDRPKITRSNFVCAEPMPGEEPMLNEFVGQLEPALLGQLVEVVFEKMKLAGEAGALLKIEEEIQDAVTEAKRQYDIGGIPVQQTLFDKPLAAGKKRYSVQELPDEVFFERAESNVIQALQQYAENAKNGDGLQRRLFADDAVRGIAFVDLCHRQFDVIVMNPPFGTASKPAQAYLAGTYPTWNKNILCSFVERTLGMLAPSGALGAIFDRTAAIKSTYENFRRNVFYSSDRPSYCADLGWDVLDANVETTAMVWSNIGPTQRHALFFDVRSMPPEHKGTKLGDAIHGESLRSHNPTIVAVHALTKLPNASMGYDMPSFFIHHAEKQPTLKESGLQSFTGAQIRAEQHFRVFWECSAQQHFTPSDDYCYMYNGGGYLRYWMPPRDVAFYGQDGNCIDVSDSSYSWRVQGKHAYFKPAVGFGVRGEYLDSHFLREGYLFTVEGQSLPLDSTDRALALVGILNSSVFQVGINSYCGQHKYSGYVNLFPTPDFARQESEEIVSHVKNTICEMEKFYSHEQTCLLFNGVPWMFSRGVRATLSECFEEYSEKHMHYENQHSATFQIIDDLVVSLFDVHDAFDLAKIQEVRNILSAVIVESLSMTDCLSDLLDYCCGILMGRWDVRLLQHSDVEPCLLPLPQPYPPCPPGSLFWKYNSGRTECDVVSESWLKKCSESSITPSSFDDVDWVGSVEYPIRIDWDGILVDDSGNQDDIVRRVRDVLEVIWKDRADAIEKEASDMLGVKTLRDYFRKPAKGGFWDDHVKRYSKSRRKAPIYWLLQSSKKNYGLWLYYHRLDKDMLFKALLNYVEPKIQREENRLGELRSEKSSAGDSGKVAKKLDRDIEKQEDLLSELRDFAEKLRKVADLHLVPDLNDGVVLNIAPLHELVPWKEAKKYWEELLDGKYEWSSIGKQLSEMGIVKE